jgi:hypothetical protein
MEMELSFFVIFSVFLIFCSKSLLCSKSLGFEIVSNFCIDFFEVKTFRCPNFIWMNCKSTLNLKLYYIIKL